MTDQIEKSFIKQYESEVHIAYQRMGSKLRNTVRNKGNVKAASTTFQKVGKGEASTKARHGKVPTMNVDHTPVQCLLFDFYAGDWVDKLDEAKTNIDERQILANAGAYALGRKTDSLIIAEMDKTTTVALDGTTGMTLDKVLAGFEKLGDGDVPDDGQLTAVIGHRQWGQLAQIKEFANADYVGSTELPWAGTSAKRWMGALWMTHTGLPLVGGVRSCFWYHKTAVGHASGAEVTADITWHGDRASNFVNHMMSQGAVLIDPVGIVKMPCLEA